MKLHWISKTPVIMVSSPIYLPCGDGYQVSQSTSECSMEHQDMMRHDYYIYFNNLMNFKSVIAGLVCRLS